MATFYRFVLQTATLRIGTSKTLNDSYTAMEVEDSHSDRGPTMPTWINDLLIAYSPVIQVRSTFELPLQYCFLRPFTFCAVDEGF